MKKNLKMELLNSEVEQQVQGGAGRFAADFTMPGGSASNAFDMSEMIVEACKCRGCSNYYEDKRGGCGSKNADNYITCYNFEVKKGCQGNRTLITPLDYISVLSYVVEK